uniref:Uncharacterized protein n=1 Tax=Panagrolaimus sp. ES5 TaxID=591445 RepID=A0AC34F7N0_9BILA
MSSKLLLNHFFSDKLPYDYLLEIRKFYESFPEEVEALNDASAANSISSLSDEFFFAIIDFFRVDDYAKSIQFSEEFCDGPISDVVKELGNNLPAINAAFDNEKEWFDLVAKTKQPFFVFFMVDKKLQNNIFNQKLWKRLIQFLISSKEFEKLLGVYSIYCRIFPTDFNMFQAYKKLVKKHGKIYVLWKKPFEFEISREKTPKKAEAISFLSMVKYVHSTRGYQIRKPVEIVGRLAFPNPIIYYIRKKASSDILQKLQQTGKYFFHVQPTLFCHRFVFADTSKETEFGQLSMATSFYAKTKPKNVVVRNTFHVSEKSDKIALSKFLPNFYKFEIKFLRIYDQKLTKREFEFIVGHGNIEIMELSDVSIYEDDATVINNVQSDKNGTVATINISEKEKKLVVLEDIIKLCPKIKEFFSSPTGISPNTAQFLQNFDFQNMVKTFYTYYINNFYDIDSYSKFLSTKVRGGRMALSFSANLEQQQVTTFIEELKQKVNCTTSFFTHIPLGNI